MAKKLCRFASVEDINRGTTRLVKIDDTPVLLARPIDEIYAIDAVCPHAGGPLDEGILDGHQVICPWHKAAFSVRTGACDEPPAVDDLCRYPVTIRDGEVFVSLEPAPVAQAVQRGADADDRHFIIIGSGGAGAAAAKTLRDEGFAGRVTMIDAEGALPYDRTILSKYQLSGEEGDEKSPLHDAAFYRDHRIERKTGIVSALRTGERRLTTEGGDDYHYDALLIATGGSPVPPPFPGADLGNVFVLRSQADAAAIVAAAQDAKYAVVVGTGFIGMEAAASLRERGLEVTVIGTEACPFDKPLGAKIGSVFQRLHEEKGIRFQLGCEVERLEGAGSVKRVVIKGGGTIEADLVIVGLGIRPATSFVTDLPLEKDGSLAVDHHLRVSETVFAAGDIATFPLGGKGSPVRVEHWRVAEQHGRIAARNMLSLDTPYESVPYFWTSHFMQRLDYVGHASGEDTMVIRGDVEDLDFIAYFERDGHVAAAAGMGRDQDMAAVLACMEARKNWTVSEIHPEGSSPQVVLQARNRERARRARAA